MHWPLIDSDLHAVYGIDTASGVLARRSAAWLRDRISGLLWRKSALRAQMMPDEKGTG